MNVSKILEKRVLNLIYYLPVNEPIIYLHLYVLTETGLNNNFHFLKLGFFFLQYL